MIPIAKPHMTKADEEAVASVIASGWILQGPKVEEFEEQLGQFIGTNYAIATSSATTAMHLGLIASGVDPGDEVIVPSLSYIASANCIVHAGATPVFVDIDPKTYNLDPADVERKITRKTKAILVVHQVGLAVDVETISKIARTHKLLLFEDCACALGSTIHGKHVGNWGEWGAFSFHPRKAITTAEGGLLVTKNKQLADNVRMLRAHGASISVKEKHDSKKVMHESFPLVGYNYRMSDIHAALGLSQFARIKEFLAVRQHLAHVYNEAFKNHPNVAIPYVPRGYFHTYQSYMIRIKDGAKSRDQIMQKLLNEGISTRAGVMASHLEKPYRTLYPSLNLPETEKAATETIILPLFPQMTKKEQKYVIEKMLAIL